jgi:hypothetical protein
MKTKLIVFGAAAVLACVAVFAAVKAKKQPNIPVTSVAATVANDEKTSASAPPQSVDLIPIVHLETRNKLVTVQSGPGGLVYLVETKDGKVLHENLSVEQLKAQAPEIHQLIKTAVAGNGSKDDSFMDARVGR